MSTMSATVHGFSVSDSYIVKYGRKYLCAKWLAFTLHDRVFALAAALMVVITIKLYFFFFNQIKATRVRESRNFGKNYLAKFSILFDDISV